MCSESWTAMKRFDKKSVGMIYFSLVNDVLYIDEKYLVNVYCKLKDALMWHKIMISNIINGILFQIISLPEVTSNLCV